MGTRQHWGDPGTKPGRQLWDPALPAHVCVCGTKHRVVRRSTSTLTFSLQRLKVPVMYTCRPPPSHRNTHGATPPFCCASGSVARPAVAPSSSMPLMGERGEGRYGGWAAGRLREIVRVGGCVYGCVCAGV